MLKFTVFYLSFYIQVSIPTFKKNTLSISNALVSVCMHAKSLQSCPTLCDTMDCSLPGSSSHGILQARILEWVAMSSSRRSSRPRDQTWVSYVLLHWHAGSLPLVPPEKPHWSELASQCCSNKLKILMALKNKNWKNHSVISDSLWPH